MRLNDILSTLKYAAAAVATLVATGATAAAAAEPAVGKGGFGETATLGQLVEFQATGLLVVFFVLGSLTVLSYLIGWILKKVAPDQYHGKPKAAHPPVAAKAPPPAAKPATPVAPTAPTVAVAPATIHPGPSDEQLMAILAVAATEALGQAVAVVSFRPLGSMDWTWSIQGRVQHHTSHTL
jgi:hypothetical protein